MSKKSVHKNSHHLPKLQQLMLLCLPFCLFFSYHPVIPIFSTSTTNFEFSLPLLWLLLFATLSLPGNYRLIKKSLITLIESRQLFKEQQKNTHPSSKEFRSSLFRLLSFVYPLSVTVLSLFSANPLRAILTAGIIWCIHLSLLTFIENIAQYKKEIGKSVQKNLLIAAAFVSLFCWLQSILDVIGTPRDLTLLCNGCVSNVFGFPHPNGFAIEPQFMANLLLAPVFLSLYYLLETPKHQNFPLNLSPYQASNFGRFLRLFLPFLLISTLYLTLSRGAIFAFWVGIFVLFVYKTIQLAKSKSHSAKFFFRQSLTFLSIIFLPLLFVLFSQGVLTELGPTNQTFMDGVSTSVSQISLGRINLASSFHSPDESNTIQETDQSSNQPIFTGYIEESTQIRLSLNKLAISSWRTSIWRIFFGVGLGTTGLQLYQEFPELGSPKEIIQNEYLAILYEQGLYGVAALILTAFMLIKLYILHNKKSISFYGFILILSFAITINFFSGLPNALHIYLLPALIFFKTEADLQENSKYALRFR